MVNVVVLVLKWRIKVKVERKDPPISKKLKFEKLKPGDSAYIEGVSRATIIQAFCQYLAKGKYSVRKENGGYRFYLLKDGE